MPRSSIVCRSASLIWVALRTLMITQNKSSADYADYADWITQISFVLYSPALRAGGSAESIVDYGDFRWHKVRTRIITSPMRVILDDSSRRHRGSTCHQSSM